MAEQFGSLDIRVNIAGVFVIGTVDTGETRPFDRQFADKLTDVIAGIRAALRLVGEGGRIISISSGIPTRVAGPGMADYAATKAAVKGYSKSTARNLGPKGITLNVVAVGSADTDMNPADGPFYARQKAGNALGRYARPEEIAAGVLFSTDGGPALVGCCWRSGPRRSGKPQIRTHAWRCLANRSSRCHMPLPISRSRLP